MYVAYFGDALVVRFFEHAWLKESWACYMESCWMEDTLLEEDFRYGKHVDRMMRWASVAHEEG